MQPSSQLAPLASDMKHLDIDSAYPKTGSAHCCANRYQDTRWPHLSMAIRRDAQRSGSDLQSEGEKQLKNNPLAQSHTPTLHKMWKKSEGTWKYVSSRCPSRNGAFIHEILRYIRTVFVCVCVQVVGLGDVDKTTCLVVNGTGPTGSLPSNFKAPTDVHPPSLLMSAPPLSHGLVWGWGYHHLNGYTFMRVGKLGSI